MFTVLKLLLYLPGALALPYEKRSSSGPVISSNFQDPCVIRVHDTWFAYSGPNGNPGVNVQIATSTDFTNWQVVPKYEVLPTPGPWAAVVPHVWAPHVIQLVSAVFESEPKHGCVNVQ
jgi:beta-xylosidase